MPTFTVQSAVKKKDVEGRNGPMQVVTLGLQEYGQNPVQAEWFTKRDTSLPDPGSKIEGDLQQGQYGLNFKKTGGGFAGGGGRAKPPEERRSIAMQASQKVAVDAVRLAVDAGAFTPESVAMTADAVVAVARKLFEQVQTAEKGPQS